MIGVVVFGPEASGTRYVTDLLTAANWNEENVILHRSVPYGRRFTPLDEVMAELDRNDTRVVICTRRADVLIASQVKNNHASDWTDSLIQQRRAYAWAVGECSRLMVPFLMTSYEAFADARYRTWVCDWALDTSDHAAADRFGFVDGNAKYL